MRVILKPGLLALSTETAEEQAAFDAWRASMDGHVLVFGAGSARGGAFHDLGPRAEACREPINVVSDMREVRWRLIGNLAPTPFVLRGLSCASVEGFWQSLKFDDEVERERVRGLSGPAARSSTYGRAPMQGFTFDGAYYLAGSPEHRGLMLEACRAKFAQNVAARAALLSTGERPLTHRVRRDSATIPGAVLADFWMRIRKSLRDAALDATDRDDDGRILYFKRDRAIFGFLSHFEPARIVIDGDTWPTVEHYYQAQKSFDPSYRAAIRAAATPGEAKKLSARSAQKRLRAQTSWFAATGAEVRPDWSEVKLEIMRRADLAKFKQNRELAGRLLATGDAILVEDSPFDDFWGVGPDGTGLNWAGRLLMEIREILREAG
jgi:ribA/ribD-fused uncharacterized protein